MDLLTDLVKWSGVITALIYVYYASRAKRICFLYGLISSILFVYFCIVEHLYFDAAINFYYIIMSVAGWLAWTANQKEFTPNEMKVSTLVICVMACIAGSLVLGYLADTYTDAEMSYIDAFTTLTAVLATWMMVRKYLENWLIWLVADGVSIFLYLYKGHPPVAGLYVVYTVISVYGYIHWRKLILRNG